MVRPVITLGDGTKPKHRALVRFRKGRDALMKLTRSEPTAFGVRLYGINICGEKHAAWASDCSTVTEEDLKHWASTEFCRPFGTEGR